MRTSRSFALTAALAVVVTVGVACAKGTTSSPGASGTTSTGGGACASVDTSTDDALAQICKSGKLRVATDPKYKPQSWYDVKSGQWKGFDVDVATEVAKRLGVAPALQQQDWDTITAGSWNNRWDVSVGSMTITTDREKLFDFTPPYYYTPAAVAVNDANTSITDVSTDLDGKKVCVGSSTTYESYLRHDLNLPPAAPKFDYVVDNPQIITFTTDTDALDALALGDGVRCDAAITASPTIADYVKTVGKVKQVGDPLYYEPLAIAFDKADPVANTTLAAAISKIVTGMHDDGTLSALSEKWYGTDLTTTSATT